MELRENMPIYVYISIYFHIFLWKCPIFLLLFFFYSRPFFSLRSELLILLTASSLIINQKRIL